MRWGGLFVWFLLPSWGFGQSPSPELTTLSASLGSPRAKANPNSVRGASPDEDPLIDSSSRQSKWRTPAATLGSISVGKPVSSIALGPVDDRQERDDPQWDNVTKPWKTTSRPRDSVRDSYTGLFQRRNGDDDLPARDDPGFAGTAGGRFTSESDFPNFISPTSNPFLAEDPRKLTEVRAIFLYQTIPHNQYLYRGGNIETFALQGRLGLTENLSLVVHKLGLLVLDPGGRSMLENRTSISEIWLGPKYTFYRSCDTGTVAAGGVIFQIPVGPKSLYQDTGNLGLVPYLTGAQKFAKSSFGEFMVLDTFGYNFSTGSQRSEFFYNTLHLDYDVANYGRIFPFIELNYFRYTSNGKSRPDLFFEGRDLANVGATIGGRSFLSTAVGSRFKFGPGFEFGIVGEFPLNGTRDLLDFRFGVDFLFRF